MANVVRDPKVHPEAVLGDFSKPDPNVNFTLDDVAFVYGSRWTATMCIAIAMSRTLLIRAMIFA